MKATTIKLDGDLLASVERAKPAAMSVTSYVKETLRRRIEADRLREAAAEYRTLSERDPQERALLDEWDAADLVAPPRTKGDAGRGRSS